MQPNSKSPALVVRPLPTRIIIAFACVYFFWGSTYVAIRFGVQVLPPLLLASVRFLISGPLMLAFCLFRGMRIFTTPREMRTLAILGILMLGAGNVGLVWAEQYLPSGLAALIIAVVPLYVALIEVFLPRGERLMARGWWGLAIGFAGLIVLLWPSMLEGFNGNTHQLLGAASALGGALSWTFGSIYSRRARLDVSPFVAAGWEMVFAGLFNSIFATAFGVWTLGHWNTTAWLSIAWLVTFGSMVGYTAYIYLLGHVPIAKVATYAYINPIVAVGLGTIFLGERFFPLEYVGMVAILLAVFLVTSSKMASGVPTTELEPVEAEA